MKRSGYMISLRPFLNSTSGRWVLFHLRGSMSNQLTDVLLQLQTADCGIPLQTLMRLR